MLSPTENSRIEGLFKALCDFPVLFMADLIFKDFSRRPSKFKYFSSLCEPWEMLAYADKWLEKLNELKFSDCREVIRFCTEILADVCEAGGHNKQCTKAIQIYNEWWEFKKRNILTFRDIQAQSVYTGKVTPLHHTPWMKAFDYSMAAFGLVPLSAKMNEQK